ncbi:MAG: hypothetical protein OEQ53_06585 [Saprospiraceae bacterium]|nr:hypothetical protein [Saprospiraceae bacterium]
MFTINIYLRFAAIGLCLIGGTVLAFLFGFWYAFPFILTGLALLVGYVLLGTVQSAAQLMEKTDFLGAEKRLNLVLNPKWLYSANRAYYYMIKGGLAMQLKRNDEAETLLMKARDTGLPSENERAMVFLQLSNLAVLKNNMQAAKIYLREAKQQKASESQIKEQILQFEKALKNQGAMKKVQHRHRGTTMQPGGKRRRPRSR